MKRSGPLRRGKGLKRGKRLKPMSNKHRAELEPRRDVRLQLNARDGGRCRLEQVAEAGPCAGPATPHHLRKAGQGGEYDVDNLVTLCARHNTWVEDHPDAAHALGLVVRRGDRPQGG